MSNLFTPSGPLKGELSEMRGSPFRGLGLKKLWWYCRACSPLPIPNREVKPLMADGTAQQCGRVGSCHILLKVLNLIVEDFFYARM